MKNQDCQAEQQNVVEVADMRIPPEELALDGKRGQREWPVSLQERNVFVATGEGVPRKEVGYARNPLLSESILRNDDGVIVGVVIGNRVAVANETDHREDSALKPSASQSIHRHLAIRMTYCARKSSTGHAQHADSG